MSNWKHWWQYQLTFFDKTSPFFFYHSGMDVQMCDLVIHFDPVQQFRSYVQSKGRARARPSRYKKDPINGPQNTQGWKWDSAVVYKCFFFVKSVLAMTHRRDVIFHAFEKMSTWILQEAFHSEGEGSSGCKRGREKRKYRSWQARWTQQVFC